MAKKKEKEGTYNEELGLWENPDGTVNVPSSNFPIALFLAWNIHCVGRHGNCRWEKMYSDHDKARAYEALIENMLVSRGIPQKEQPEEDIEESDSGIKKVNLFRPLDKEQKKKVNGK